VHRYFFYNLILLFHNNFIPSISKISAKNVKKDTRFLPIFFSVFYFGNQVRGGSIYMKLSLRRVVNVWQHPPERGEIPSPAKARRTSKPIFGSLWLHPQQSPHGQGWSGHWWCSFPTKCRGV